LVALAGDVPPDVAGRPLPGFPPVLLGRGTEVELGGGQEAPEQGEPQAALGREEKAVSLAQPQQTYLMVEDPHPGSEDGRGGAELVVIPQAGTVGEWPEGLYEAEVRVAAFQNGYFAALCNRVGEEGKLHFSGESFAVDPQGRVLARGKVGEEDLVLVDLDLAACRTSTAQRLFWRHRRPELYRKWLG
jgi:hypothetical protein